MVSAAQFTRDKVASDPNLIRMNAQLKYNASTTRSFKRIPAGQGNTVAVSGQYDPRQKASGIFLNITQNGSFPLLFYYRPKNMAKKRRAVKE